MQSKHIFGIALGMSLVVAPFTFAQTYQVYGGGTITPNGINNYANYSNYSSYGTGYAGNAYTYNDPYTYNTNTSNTSVVGNTNPQGIFFSPYFYNNSNACGFGSAGTCGTQGGYPVVSYVTPSTGSIESVVTVYGAGFSPRGNAVYFGSAVIANLLSNDGHTLTFRVPTNLVGYNSNRAQLGTYGVSVSDAQGALSNEVPFTVNSLFVGDTPVVEIESGPTNLAGGEAGTWNVLVTGPNNASVTVMARFGDENVTGEDTVSPVIILSGPQRLTFTHEYDRAGEYIPSFIVRDSAGRTSNVQGRAVTVRGTAVNSNTLSLRNIAPARGRVGTLVVLQGTGFAQSGNKVHFGVGGTASAMSSNNGTVMYFTIPYTVSPCDISGGACNATVVTPGTYQISVENSRGQSVTRDFTVIP